MNLIIHSKPIEEVTALLYAFVAGTLDAETHHQVAEHLNSCTKCQEEVLDARVLQINLEEHVKRSPKRSKAKNYASR